MSNIRPYVIINGVDSRTIQGLLITSLPPISKPAQRTLTETIDGRDGDSSIKLGFSAYDKSLGIALTFGYNVDDIISFFNSEGTIIFSNEPDKLYNFEIFEAIDFEKLIRFKTATVTIHTQPFKFSTTENPLEFTNKEFTVVNNGNTDSRPNLVITGEGLATMQINGKNALNIDFGDAEQTLLIDSEGMNAYYTNNIKSIEAEIVPKQDLHGFDNPFIDSDVVNKVPYLSRALAGTAERIGNYEYNKLVGGTVAYNQYANKCFATTTQNGITITNNADGSYTLNGTATSNTMFGLNTLPLCLNHIYLALGNKGGSYNTYYLGVAGIAMDFGAGGFWKSTLTANSQVRIDIRAGATIDNVTITPQIFDLTQMLGATIADYIYSLEQAQAGAGVAYFKALGFNKDYYPYNAGELMSVKTSAHVTKNAGGAVIQTVALDPNLELRGIPKLDANNKLYYDGDTYSADGSVSRRYGVVDLGSLTPVMYTVTEGNLFRFELAQVKKIYTNTTIPNLLCHKYLTVAGSVRGNKTLSQVNNSVTVDIIDNDYNSAEAFKTAMSGIYLVYEKENPTAETAQAFNNPIAIDANGSEEFTDSRAVAIPVGHESFYANICDIEGFTEVNLVRAGVNIWDGTKQDNVGVNATTGNLYASAGAFTTDYILIKPNASFYANPTSWKTWACFYDSNKTYVGYTSIVNGILTTPANAYYMRISGNMSELATACINYPASNTAYSAYAGEIFKAEFEQEGEPVIVYGGKYNFTTGLLELTHAITDLGGLTYTKQTSGDKWAFIANSPTDSFNTKTIDPSNYPFKSELYPQTAYNPINETFNCFTMNNQYTGASKVIRIRDTRYTDETAFKNAVQGYKLCYELNEHIFIELDEQIISALLGINNFYADTGNVTVIFVNDGQDETQTGAIVSFDLDESDLNKGDLANRLVSGNYANIRLKTGSNAIKFIGSVSAVGLDKYSRWL